MLSGRRTALGLNLGSFKVCGFFTKEKSVVSKYQIFSEYEELDCFPPIIRKVSSN